MGGVGLVALYDESIQFSVIRGYKIIPQYVSQSTRLPRRVRELLQSPTVEEQIKTSRRMTFPAGFAHDMRSMSHLGPRHLAHLFSLGKFFVISARAASAVGKTLASTVNGMQASIICPMVISPVNAPFA